MKYQLWHKDEYNTSIIVGTYDEPASALTKARSLVTEANFSNSLSAAEQMRNIESYLVEIKHNGEIASDTYYAGNRRGGKFWKFSAKDNVVESFEPDAISVSIYIGSKFTKTNGQNIEKRVYLQNEKKIDVTKIDDALLNAKGMYFVVPID